MNTYGGSIDRPTDYDKSCGFDVDLIKSANGSDPGRRHLPVGREAVLWTAWGGWRNLSSLFGADDVCCWYHNGTEVRRGDSLLSLLWLALVYVLAPSHSIVHSVTWLRGGLGMKRAGQTGEKDDCLIVVGMSLYLNTLKFALGSTLNASR